MSRIDISQWKEFSLSQMFDICYGKFIPKKDRGTKTPMITTTADNNGISYYVDSDPLFSGDALTVASDGSVGSTFYQDKDFSAGNIVVVLEPKKSTKQNWSPRSAQFLATCIKRYALIKYGWTNKYSVNRVRNTKLPLPVDSNGDPDWQYMDTYIAKLTTLAHKNVSSLKKAKAKPAKLNIDHWDDFKLSELFEPEFTDGDNKVGQLEEDDTGVNLIGPLNSNNGILGKFISNTKIFPKNTLTWDMFGTCYWQKEPYQTVSHGHVLVLNPKVQINSASLLYLATILTKLGHQKQFGYTNMLTINKYNKLYVKLPIDAKGEPDWEYMSNQVRHLATLSDLTITSLDPAKLPIFVGEWKECSVNNVFNVFTGAQVPRRYLINGSQERISVTNDNNGVISKFDEQELLKSSNARILTNFVSINFFGYAFYHKNRASLEMKVHAIQRKDNVSFSENQGLYIASLLNSQYAGKYGYGNQLSSSKLINKVIKLPVDFNGDPDWQYMEQYISWIKQYSKNKLALIQ